MHATIIAAGFVTASRLIREAIAKLQSVGQNVDNGYFGSVMQDLERIHRVCVGRGNGMEDGPDCVFTAPTPVPVKSNKRIIPAAAAAKAAAQTVAAPAPKVEPAPAPVKVETPPAPVTYPTTYKGVMGLKAGIDAVASALDVNTAGMTYVNKCGAVWAAIQAATPAKVKAAPQEVAAPAPVKVKAAKPAKVKAEKAAKPADPIVAGVFDASGKPMTLSAVMAALEGVAKGK